MAFLGFEYTPSSNLQYYSPDLKQEIIEKILVDGQLHIISSQTEFGSLLIYIFCLALIVVNAESVCLVWSTDGKVEVMVLLVQTFGLGEFEISDLAAGHVTEDIIFDDHQRLGKIRELIKILLKLIVILRKIVKLKFLMFILNGHMRLLKLVSKESDG